MMHWGHLWLQDPQLTETEWVVVPDGKDILHETKPDLLQDA